MREILLARHATPDWNRKDLAYHLPPGPPLTDQGVAEAEALGRYFQQAGVRWILTSPLERCQRTAEIAGLVAGATVEIEMGLTEWQPGEQAEAVIERLWPAFERACQWGQADDRAALVTHGGPIAVLLVRLGMDAGQVEKAKVFDHRNLLPPAGVWRASQEQHGMPWELSLIYPPGSNGSRTSQP